jgi:hypothetical protein
MTFRFLFNIRDLPREIDPTRGLYTDTLDVSPETFFNSATRLKFDASGHSGFFFRKTGCPPGVS